MPSLRMMGLHIHSPIRLQGVVPRGIYRVFKNSFTMVLQMLLCDECYEDVFVTLATQKHLEYHCKALFEVPCITTGSQIEL
jgi:hypothetical protein